MSKFKKTDEKEFLLGYLKFTSEIRVRALEALSEHFHQSKLREEKLSYYILGLEQLLLLFETLQAFYVAFRDRKTKPFIDSLNKNIKIQYLYDSIKDKNREQIIKGLDYVLQSPMLKQNTVKKRLSNIANMWGNEKFKNVMKIIMNPLFNAIKHKTLLYEKDGKIMFVLGDKEEEQASKLLKDLGIKGLSTQSFDEITEIATRWRSAIKDLIVLRLLELKVEPSEIVNS